MSETIQFIATTFDFLGKFLLGVTVLFVHLRVRKEHKIDKKVLASMRREMTIGIMGIILIVIAYLLHLYLLV